MITFENGARVKPRENTGGGSYDVEASQIGLAPGEWPQTIVVTLDARGMEPAMPVELLKTPAEYEDFRAVDEGGDLRYVFYESRLGGTTLTIWND